jgi:UDP-N-acetylglucosamine acyltransferase
MVDRDVPPFCVAAGDRAAIVAPNVVGLRRRGATREAIAALRAAFRLLFRESRAWRAALRACAPLGRDEPLVRALLDFLEASRLGVRRGG